MRRRGTGLQSRFESSNATTINIKSNWDKSSKTKEVALEMERRGENPEIHKKYNKLTYGITWAFTIPSVLEPSLGKEDGYIMQ